MPKETVLIAHAAAAVPLLIWLYLALLRGNFWRLSQRLTPVPSGDVAPRRIVVVIPARDEAALIGAAVDSLLRQTHRGPVRIIVVDDNSSDGTAAAATAAAAALGASARLTVLRGAPLEPGWTGKLWAMSQGAAAAAALQADYLLFTDADVLHEPEEIAALVANAETGQRDLVSCMVELSTATLAERCLIPAFVFFFFELYPPEWIACARSGTAGAAGGCMLMRPQTLARIGGLSSIHSALIDDCALARATKAAGGRLWLGLTRLARSSRPYASFRAVGQMISRSAFNQLRHSYLLLTATLAGLCVTYLMPPLLLLSRDATATALGAAAWALMCICYAPMVRFYRLSPLWTLSLPAVAMFYAGATLHSAAMYATRRGGHWKGRIQDV